MPEQDKLKRNMSEESLAEQKSEPNISEPEILEPSVSEQVVLKRCPQCAAAIYEEVDNCPLCQAELLGSFAINQDLIEESVENLLVLLRAEFDLKSLRLAEDTQQLMARAKIREMVRDDSMALTIFERGVVLQHLLNIIFNSRDEDTL